MTDYEDMMRGTAREWFWARIVLIGGFIIAVAVAGFFAWQQHADRVAAQQADIAAQQARMAAVSQMTQQRRAAIRQDAKEKGAMLFCAMELVNAKNMGIVPSFGQLASPLPRKTDTQGRYACLAATQASKYEIQADLVCANVEDTKCVHLHSIKTDDGTVLYQAKN